MFRRTGLIVVLMLVAVKAAMAQYDPSFSHYWAVEPSYNPAAVGKDTKLNVNGVYNMTMVGFEHNPRTMFIAADMPLNLLGGSHGVGLQLVNDDIGLFSHKRVSAQYAYKHSLLGGTISVGVQAGFLSETFDGSKIELEQDNDLAFSKSSVNGSAFDLGAGIRYNHRRWFVGASVQHATAPTVELGETNELETSQTFYFSAGYNIRLRNPFLTLDTYLLGRTDAVAYRADVTARLKYTHEKRVMYAGLSCSPTNSVTVLLGGMFHGVMFGYGYEVYTSAINIGNGSHELFVGYQTDIDLFKKGRNRHQSVRIL